MSLLPKILFEIESPLSGKIRVIQDGKERRLVVGGLVQSINADAEDVEERIWGQLARVESGELRVENALILGLGGGTVAHLLTKKFGPIPIDGVEIDPLIVEIGKNFFDLGKLKNLNIIIGDAVDPISRQQFNHLTIQPYDLVIVDLYCGSQYPKGAESDEFFAGLKNLTHPRGSIVFNRISTETDVKFEEKLRKTFCSFQKKLVPSKFGGENLVFKVLPSQKQGGGEEGGGVGTGHGADQKSHDEPSDRCPTQKNQRQQHKNDCQRIVEVSD